MARRTALLLCLLVSALARVPAFAQDAPAAEAPAHISLVDGPAVLERDGQVDAEPQSMPLIAGDRIRTQGGRVEVLFADGSALHLDANTVVDFQSDEVIRLLDGRIRLSISGPSRDVSYRIDAPSAWVQINDPGEYRVAILGNADVELAVLRGAAELVNEQGRSYIRAGERTFARAGSAPSAPYVFNSAAWDAFDRWSETRRDGRLGVSAQYLPSDVRPYAASFDAYGDWRYEQAYGYVWYPRVYTGWRPYHRGRWVSLRPYGWTWIAADPWGWPTHHYGRWGISAGAWFWIPGRHWGPAWVSWAYTPNYVSWCPLGWNNRPVLQIVNINLFGGRRYSPWHAWTVVPRRHFSTGFVHVGRVASVRIDQRIHNTFIVRDRAPEVRHAVGRSAPIRTAGRYAVPRGSVPGTFASDAGTMTTRSGDGRVDARGGQRFPTARSSRSASPNRSPRDRQASPASPVTGGRAVAREPAATDQGRTLPDRAGQARETGAREYRRSPSSRGPTGDSANQPVTAPPDGAVRAVPRVRQPAQGGSPDAARSAGSAGQRTRTRQERAPSASVPVGPSAPSVPRARQRSSAAPVQPGFSTGVPARTRQGRPPEYGAPSVGSPAARPSEADVYRPGSGYRRAPDSGGESRSRAVPAPRNTPTYRSRPEMRRGPSGPPPGARSAPEMRGPSGPPPAAARPQPQRSRGESARPSGGSRQPSGEARATGQRARPRR